MAVSLHENAASSTTGTQERDRPQGETRVTGRDKLSATEFHDRHCAFSGRRGASVLVRPGYQLHRAAGRTGFSGDGAGAGVAMITRTVNVIAVEPFTGNIRVVPSGHSRSLPSVSDEHQQPFARPVVEPVGG